MIIISRLLCHPTPAISNLKPNPKSPIKSTSCSATNNSDDFNKQKTTSSNTTVGILSNTLISLAISVVLITPPLPSSAIPFPNSKPSSLPSTTTPFSQARNLPTGLENGKIRACPSINPACISTNPKSSNFAFPWSILGDSNSDSVSIQKLKDAIMKTQKNVKIQLVEDASDGKYLQAEVDGGFGRDVLEFLVKGDVVSYRAMATKVTYIYPFTTALGDSKGQEARMKQIIDELGWYAPSFDSMDMIN